MISQDRHESDVALQRQLELAGKTTDLVKEEENNRVHEWLVQLPVDKKEKKISPELFPLAINRIEMFFANQQMQVNGVKAVNGFKFQLTDATAKELLKFINISGSSLVKIGTTRNQRRLLS